MISESIDIFLDSLQRCSSIKSFSIPESPIDLTDTAWTPHAVCKLNNKDTLIHIHTVDDEIPHFLIKRILAADTSNYQVLIISGYKILKNYEHFKALLEINAFISFIGFNSNTVNEPKHISLAVAQSNIKVKKELLFHLLELSRNASSISVKGKRFEQLLCLFFSQIEDFHIFNSNYRTETEEIDIVIQLRESCSLRCWARFEAPFIFIEAKNQEKKVGQKIVSQLLGILSTKGSSTKLGITVSMSGFSAEAKTQALRYSEAKKKIILLTGNEIENMIKSDDLLDDQLEQLVSKALIN
jgi:hypothetical protein